MSTEGRKDNWLLSFSDLVTLLVCLFVMLISVSSGKGLAEGGGGHEVQLQASDFSENGMELSVAGVNTLHALAKTAGNGFLLQGCQSEFEGQWLGRAVTVMRHFSDGQTGTDNRYGSALLAGGECAAGSVMRVRTDR